MLSSHNTVVGITTAILASLFVAALLALLFICRQRLVLFVNNLNNKEKAQIENGDQAAVIIHPSGSSVYLINNQDNEHGIVGIDPEDLIIHPDLDKLTEAHRWKWIDDALGVVPHCLHLLKGCHTISEKLVATALASTDHEKFVELASVAQEVLPLVDDLLHSMCPPIEARVIENRASLLMKAVKKLGSLIRRTCNVTWPNVIVSEMSSHHQELKILADHSERHNIPPNAGPYKQTEREIIMESSLT